MTVKKRGQRDAGGAAGLVAIILLLIVFYIVFLPPEDREDLLDDDNETNGNGDDDGNKTLLREFPGELSIVDRKDADRDIPNVFLFESRNAEVIERFNPFSVRNGWFDTQGKSLTFSIDDLTNTDNVLLSFASKVNKGILSINFNGVNILEFNIETENPDPIKLSNLQDTNTLDFSVSGVGPRFWSTNEYTFEDVKIIGDVTDTSQQESKSIFTLKDEEFQNLEKASLRFVPYCRTEEEAGRLDVFVNNREIFSATPVCDDPAKQEFSIGTLQTGTNTLAFRSEKGSYSIEQIEFNLDLKETKSVVYFFELNETDFDDVRDGDKDVILEIDFVDDDEDKIADLNINDHLRRIDQRDDFFDMNINSLVEEGNNFVEIRPKEVLRIVEIEVRLED